MNEDPLQELSMQQRDWIAVFHFLNKDQSSVSNYRNECSSPIERVSVFDSHFRVLNVYEFVLITL